MPAYKTRKRTQQYSLKLKKKAVLWSHEPHLSLREVPETLDIHLTPNDGAVFRRSFYYCFAQGLWRAGFSWRLSPWGC